MIGSRIGGPILPSMVKFLFKIALVILAARVLAGTPRGSNHDIDAVGDFSLREIACGITSAVAKAEDAVCEFWRKPEDAPAKDAWHHDKDGHHQANSF